MAEREWGLGLKLNRALPEWNGIQGWVKGTISEAAGERVCWQERTHQSLSNRMRIHPLTRRLCFSLQWETGNIFRWDVLLLSHPKRLYPSFRAQRRDWEASLSCWPHLASSKFPHSFCFHLRDLTFRCQSLIILYHTFLIRILLSPLLIRLF